MAASEGKCIYIVQYSSFMSFVHPSFWHTLTEMKLDVDKLNDTTKQIWGRFTNRDDMGAVFEVDGTSFNKEPEDDQLYTNVRGTLLNKNTIEEFKSINKATFLTDIGKEIWAGLQNKEWITKPSTLLNFVVLTFADLKKFNYTYWFGFPAPMQPTVYLEDKSLSIIKIFSPKQITELEQSYNSLDKDQKCFFAFSIIDDTINVITLSKLLDLKKGPKKDINLSSMYFVFNDPSNTDNPGWPLRMYIAILTDHCPSLLGADLKAIGLRCNPKGNIESSRYFLVTAAMEEIKTEPCTVTDVWVGWERNDKGFGPKRANMSASLDPVILADTASDLNIKLMKWRLAPEINVDVMKSTKCLLLGAGTLGCHVARDLLAWGFRHITFIDNGKVSYSNPTRQVLFNFQDCLNGGRMKAAAAADSLKSILPTVVSKGMTAHIPMPGHPIGESLKLETISHLQLITKAIAEHDVIFLLLDTREARWLPTLIAAHYGKIVINAALGFDSYLVMRHGVGDSNPGETTSVNRGWIAGGNLGCYFCNDVTAPGNSQKDRTLDQQCTVTRPGVAAIAGALAVEILVGLLQHPLRVNAPALYNIDTYTDDIPPQFQGVLGPIPHTIRGFLHSYKTVTPTCAKFKQCVACSEVVIKKYREENIAFLLNVFASGNYLEQVTGLHELHLAAEMTEIMTFSDEDED